MTCLPVTSPPNGGNCTIRGATRRRHAEGRLLMLQNPPIQPWVRRGRRGELRPGVARITEHLGHHAHASHCSSRWSAPWAPHTREPRPHCPEPRPHRQQTGGLALHGDPCVTCLPVTSPSNGGNCTIRGATRRRHAEGRLLMLQNPPSSPGCGGVAGVNCVPESPASQSIWAISPTTPRCRRL